MDENVKRLVLELPGIVQRNTNRSYEDVQKILTSLQTYIKRPMAGRSGVLKKLDALEALLSTRFQEKNHYIFKHTQLIRQILDVGMKGNSGNTSSSENRRLSDVLTGSGTTDADIQKLRPSSGGKICDELNKLGMKEDDGASVHNESLKTEMRQLQLENQYLKTILENLHRNIIVGEATSHRELKQPEDLKSNKTLTELSTMTEKVTNKFYELETKLEYVHGRISQLCYMIIVNDGSEVQIPSLERTNKFTAMGRKLRSNPAQVTPPTERSLKLDKHLELLSSTLTEMKETKSQVKTLKKDKKFMVQLLDALHESVTGVEHNTSKNKPSAAPGTAPSRHELTTNILRTFQEKKNEAEYAACLLEELSNVSHATNNDDNGNILTPPQNFETSHDFKERDDKNVENSRNKIPQYTHDESLMKCYRCAYHVLKNMKESERLRKDLVIKKGQIEDLMERLKHIQNENTKLVKEADSLRTRQSEHAGALLHHDNPAIADLSDPNRPTKLGEKYLELYDNQWIDAFFKLQTEYSGASDEELTGYLYKLLVDGYVFCADARHAQKFNLQEIMLNPTGDMTKSQIRPKQEVSKGFSNILTDAAKLSTNVASGNIAKAFVKNEGTKIKHGKRIQLCQTYIQGCVELCWYMHVQTPPLCLDLNTTKGHAFEKNKYKEYTTSGKKIAFVVWPALFLHENGPLLSKGVAQGDSTRKKAAVD